MPKAITTQSIALHAHDFTPLIQHGWEDPLNSTISAMTWFKNRLYCGTTRTSLCLLNDAEMSFQWHQSPVPCGDYTPEQQRAEIHRLSPKAQKWERILQSPLQKRRGGHQVPYEVGYACMQVWQGDNDPSPALYVGTLGYRGGTGARILRSLDGITFDAVHRPDPGRKGLSSFPFLIPFKDALFTVPMNTSASIEEDSNNATVFMNTDPLKKKWQAVSERGFGEPWNVAISAMIVFNDHLYAATQNPAMGFQIWKTDAEGDLPYHWQCVLSTGADRQHFNRGITSMAVFNNKLYIGTGMRDSVASKGYRQGVAGAEILCIDQNDHWQLVIGASRLTKQGFKPAISGIKPGFNNYFNRDISQLINYNGHLYAGTFNWASFLPYIDTQQWPMQLQTMAKQIKTSQLTGFSLWRSADGVRWKAINENGFDNPHNCAIDTILPSTKGLFVSASNPFTPNDGTPSGAQLWLAYAESEFIESSANKDTLEIDPSLYELSQQRLHQLQNKIDLSKVMPDLVNERLTTHQFTWQDESHLPKHSAALIIANHPGTPLLEGGTVIMEDTLIALHQINQYLNHPIRHLANLEYYNSAERLQQSRDLLERLGYVPNTRNNAIQLLKDKTSLLLYPETKPSKPGYQMRPFIADFIHIAWHAGAPIIPMLFLGPQERQLLVEYNDEQVVINKAKPLPAPYNILFLRPIRIRIYVQDINNQHQVDRCCTMIEKRMQTQLDQACLTRPLVEIARKLQTRYGNTDKKQER